MMSQAPEQVGMKDHTVRERKPTDHVYHSGDSLKTISCCCCCRWPSSVASDPETAFYNRTSSTVLESVIEIERPVQEVWDAINTSRLWQLVYPETISVGGQTVRPFEKGDIIFEKFLYGGLIYAMFDYTVNEQTPPDDAGHAHAVFTGRMAIENTLLAQCCGVALSQSNGTFEYFLESQGSNVTKWTRRVYFYHSGGCMASMVFKSFLAFVWPSQKRGAQIFVEATKRFLESDYYKENLYVTTSRA